MKLERAVAGYLRRVADVATNPEWIRAEAEQLLRKLRPRERELPDEAHARKSDPLTSEAAALSVHELPDRHRGVLDALRTYGPMIDEELVRCYQRVSETMEYDDADAWPLQTQQSIRSRRHELELAQLVEWTGQHQLTIRGRRAREWRAV